MVVAPAALAQIPFLDPTDRIEAMAERLTPQWETIQPRSKEDCIRESGGVLNNAFVRCRNGRQESVTYDRAGRRKIHQERPIPQ